MYLHDENVNHNTFYQPRKTMMVDDRIKDDKEGGIWAVMLYAAIEDKISLSKFKHTSEGKKDFVDSNGEYYCCLPEKDALKEIGIKSSNYKQCKKFLQRAGLIHFKEQAEKKAGVASRIYVKPWDIWAIENGYYSDDKWIQEPTIEDYYDPKNIIRATPRNKKELVF
ncbi:hypothetical protein [Neobacillus niacini]|uniref:hypothetical protein n=1 Tax=Neobacillus niacini TaxID=86668 RepID=UPI0005F063BE|nr:hypothetical protein [Neobacillus niacini]